ncbi:MAG: hypothetical protein WEB58_13170 [Planctomycetaceae bacterium]
MYHRVQRRLAPALCGLLILSIFGCGGEEGRGLPKSPVSGKVTFNGETLPDGTITFIHQSGDISAVSFGADGLYQLDVAEGKNEILVKSADITGGGTAGADGNRSEGMEIHKSRIPERYVMVGQTGLTLDVKPGENKFDVKLEGEAPTY